MLSTNIEVIWDIPRAMAMEKVVAEERENYDHRNRQRAFKRDQYSCKVFARLGKQAMVKMEVNPAESHV